MARRQETTDRELKSRIRRVDARGEIGTDTRGLILQVTGGSASWIYRYQIAGKRRRMGLGSYPVVTLAEARQKALEATRLARAGTDPIENARIAFEAERAPSVTFDTCAADYISSHRDGWKNAKHAQQWEKTIATYVSPTIGKLAPADVTTEHILEILKPLWIDKTETATRLRSRIELVLDAAKARGLRTGENPAKWRGHLSNLLPKARSVRQVRHHPALPWGEVPGYWQGLALSTKSGAPPLRLLILTALRVGAVIGATWSEFDLDAKVWTVPAERMKGAKAKAKAFRVPLSEPALAVLRAQKGAHTQWVFPSPGRGRNRTGHLSNAALDLALGRDDITTHGFRSTFRDWAAEETHHPRDVCEMALDHAIASGVEAAYRRGDLLDKRRVLMDEWARYVSGVPVADAGGESGSA